MFCYQSYLVMDDEITGERKEGFGTVILEADKTRTEIKSTVALSTALEGSITSASLMCGPHTIGFTMPITIDSMKLPIVEVHSVRPSAFTALSEGTATVHVWVDGANHVYATGFTQSCPTSRSYATISSNASSAILKRMKKEGTNHLRRGDKVSSVRKAN